MTSRIVVKPVAWAALILLALVLETGPVRVATADLQCNTVTAVRVLCVTARVDSNGRICRATGCDFFATAWAICETNLVGGGRCTAITQHGNQQACSWAPEQFGCSAFVAETFHQDSPNACFSSTAIGHHNVGADKLDQAQHCWTG